MIKHYLRDTETGTVKEVSESEFEANQEKVMKTRSGARTTQTTTKSPKATDGK